MADNRLFDMAEPPVPDIDDPAMNRGWLRSLMEGMMMGRLAEELRAACNGAAGGDKIVTLALFAIQNVDRLKGENLHDLAEEAGVGRASGAELRRGMRLADYVQLKV